MRIPLGIGLVAAAALGGAAWFGAPFLEGRGELKLRHLPGPLSDGHWQIATACDACHTPFAGVTNDACRRCHGEALEEAKDSHPESKFTDPRNAERVAELDARRCVVCHQEHVPDRTRRGGVTLAVEFCRSCHADVASERPSHAGLAFTSCADVGCHNFHDNRALNESFLVRHLDEPRLLPGGHLPERAAPRVDVVGADAPPALANRTIEDAWATSLHQRAGVSCGSCHRSKSEEWQLRPALAVCRECHEDEGRGFDGGRHGMRAAAGLAPMTPSLAHRPMKADAGERGALGCGSCHDVHTVDTRRAAVESCLGCHDDEHSRAFEGSPHHRAGLTCATCHLPRRARSREDDTVIVEHDQNANLRPANKMVRTVCMSCHGVGYSLDALADAPLAARNFPAPPSRHLATLDWVAERERVRKARRAKKQLEEGKETP